MGSELSSRQWILEDKPLGAITCPSLSSFCPSVMWRAVLLHFMAPARMSQLLTGSDATETSGHGPKAPKLIPKKIFPLQVTPGILSQWH